MVKFLDNYCVLGYFSEVFTPLLAYLRLEPYYLSSDWSNFASAYFLTYKQANEFRSDWFWHSPYSKNIILNFYKSIHVSQLTSIKYVSHN